MMALLRRLGLNTLLVVLSVVTVNAWTPHTSLVFGQAETAQPEGNDQQEKSSTAAIAIYADAAGYQNNKQFDLADAEWRKFLQRFADDPKASEARYNLAICEIQQDDFSNAVDNLQQVIAAGKKFERLGDAYLNLGLAHYSLALQQKTPEQFAQAAKAFTTVLDEYPAVANRDQALFFRGESLYQQEKRKESAASYRELIEKHPDSDLRSDAMYALGVAHEELGDYAQAGKVFDRFLVDFPENELTAEVRMRKAETILQAGDFAAAEKIFAQVAGTEGFHAADHARYRQAFCLVQQQHYAKAAKVFSAIVEEMADSPYAPDAAMSAGRAYYRAQEYDDAVKWFSRIEKSKSPHAPEAVHWHARILLDRDEPQQARDLIASILPIDLKHPFLVRLKLDDADALYDMPATRKESIAAYLRIATDDAEHRLAPKALYNAAFGAMELGDFLNGLAYAQQFFAKYEKHVLRPDVQKVVAECQLQLGHHDAAAKAFAELAASGDADGTRYQLRLGLSLYLQKKYEEAMGVFNEVRTSTQSAEEKAESAYWMGRCLVAQQHFAKAITAFEASLQAKPNWRQSDEVLLNLARAMRRVDRLGDARSTVTKLISTYPQSGVLDQAHYRLAEFSYASADYETALANYNKVVQGWPESKLVPFSLYGRGWSQLRSSKPADATAAFSRLLEFYGDHELAGQTLYARATARHQSGDHRGALDDVEAFLETAPDATAQSDALYLRGLCHVALKDQKAAIQSFDALLQANSNYGSVDKVLYEQAWAHKNARDEKVAVAVFQKLVETAPQSPLVAEAHYHIGESLYAEKQYDAATEQYEAAQATSASKGLRAKTAYKLGWSHFQSGRYEKALAAFEQQLEVNDADNLAADAVFMRGECYFKLKRYQDAMDAYATAMATPSENSTMLALTYLHRGQAAAQVERWQDSLQWTSEFTQKFPESPYLAQAMFEQASAQRNLGQLDAAVELFTQVTEKSRSVLGARARFMAGEVLFEKKDYAEAILAFRRVMFGYGAEKAPADIQSWQAKSAFEAGRCASVLANQEGNPERRSQFLESARGFFRFVVNKHGQTEEAQAAKQQLQRLGS